MLTLRHAFDANSMKGLVLKILRGTYPPIPQHYSEDCRNLVVETLRKEPSKRPSVRKILEKEFLSARISQLLSRTVARHEFAQVSIRKPKMVLQPSSVHSHTPISNVGGVSIEEGRTFSEHGKGEKTHSEREREHRDHRDFREREKNIGLHASHVRNKYTKEILEENKIIENKKHDFEEPVSMFVLFKFICVLDC
jgi:serine/threonine protein kinase